jgi:hypothetical protein
MVETPSSLSSLWSISESENVLIGFLYIGRIKSKGWKRMFWFIVIQSNQCHNQGASCDVMLSSNRYRDHRHTMKTIETSILTG